MRSSTSASDPKAAARAIVVLLAAMTVYFVALEVAMRTVLPRISANQRRIVQDANRAQALTARSADGAHTVLLVGNSLLVQGVDRQQLQQRLLPQYAVTYYP